MVLTTAISWVEQKKHSIEKKYKSNFYKIIQDKALFSYICGK